MQLPLERPENYSSGRQTTPLMIYTEVSKLAIEGTGEVVRCRLYTSLWSKVMI